jgi:hypothetical protein
MEGWKNGRVAQQSLSVRVSDLALSRSALIGLCICDLIASIRFSYDKAVVPGVG